MVMQSTSLDLTYILGLYDRFAADLARVRRYMRLLRAERFDEDRLVRNARVLRYLAGDLFVPVDVSRPSWAQLDDLEAELTYLLLRDRQPETVVEVSPCGGWSTAWILNALHDNGRGRLCSFDTRDDSTIKVPADLAAGIREFFLGDVRQSAHLPAKIDSLFLDSDHSAPFAEWFIAELFPRVRPGGLVSVHDVFHAGGPAASGGEGPVVLAWLRAHDVPWLTASPTGDAATFAAISAHRQQYGAVLPVQEASANPALFFEMA